MDPIEVLGPERIEIYQKNHFPVSKALQYFKGQGRQYQANMLGMETEYQTLKQVERLQATDIETEVDIGTTAIDILCTMDKLTAIEVKANITNNKCVRQILKYKGHYKDAKVLVAVPRETKISESIQREVKSIDGDFLFLDLTREEVISGLLGMQKVIRGLN